MCRWEHTLNHLKTTDVYNIQSGSVSIRFNCQISHITSKCVFQNWSSLPWFAIQMVLPCYLERRSLGLSTNYPDSSLRTGRCLYMLYLYGTGHSHPRTCHCPCPLCWRLCCCGTLGSHALCCQCSSPQKDDSYLIRCSGWIAYIVHSVCYLPSPATEQWRRNRSY